MLWRPPQFRLGVLSRFQRQAMALGLFLGAWAYFGFLVVLGAPTLAQQQIDELEDTLSAALLITSFLPALAVTIFAYRRIPRIDRQHLYPLLIGAAAVLGTYSLSTILINVYAHARDYTEWEATVRMAPVAMVIWLPAPLIFFAATRRVKAALIPRSVAAAPPSPVLASHFKAIRWGAFILAVATGVLVVDIAVSRLLKAAIAGNETLFQPPSVPFTQTQWSPNTATILLVGALIVAPVVSFAVYRQMLRLSGLVLLLRPFHRPQHKSLDRIVRAACSGVSRCVTMQDTVLQQSLLAGLSSRWMFGCFLLPLWSFGAYISVILGIMATDAVTADADEYLNSVLIPIILLWTTVFVWLTRKRIKRFGVVTLDSTRGIERAESFIADVRTGHLFGGGVHILRCPENIWRHIVVVMLRHADLVVIDVTFLTDNILWEVSQALLLLPPQRIVLVCHSLAGGYASLPKQTLHDLESHCGADVSSCVALTFSRFISLRWQPAADTLRQLVERARFQHDVAQQHNEQRHSAENIRGWLRVPVVELIYSGVDACFRTVFGIYSLWAFHWHRDEVDISEEFVNVFGSDPESFVRFSLWWLCLSSALTFGASLYLMRLMLRRRRRFVTAMIIWFTARIWLYSLGLYSLMQWRLQELTVGGYVKYMCDVLVPMPVFWFVMILYMARSQRVRHTFGE